MGIVPNRAGLTGRRAGSDLRGSPGHGGEVRAADDSDVDETDIDGGDTDGGDTDGGDGGAAED